VHFGTFVQAAREMEHLTFAHIDHSTYDKGELHLLRLTQYLENSFVLRFFRRGNFHDYKEYVRLPVHSYPGKPGFESVDGMKDFIKDSMINVQTDSRYVLHLNN
jgi:hypothetical protein